MMGVRKGKGISRIATMRTIIIASAMGILLYVPNIRSQEVAQLDSEAENQGCLDDLLMADDGDLELKTNEYLMFVALRSGGQLGYMEYSDMPFSLIATFNFGACFCAMISSDDQCCVGENANVNLDVEASEMIKDNLFTFCRSVDRTIASIVPDTPSPTMAPTAVASDAPSETPTDMPTRSSSSSPTLVATMTPTVVPSDAPSETPTDSPSAVPTTSPSPAPSNTPSAMPTAPSFSKFHASNKSRFSGL
jgi:hypothetical protein